MIYSMLRHTNCCFVRGTSVKNYKIEYIKQIGVFSLLKPPLQVVVCRSSASRMLNHVLVRYGNDRHGLLDQSIEQIAVVATSSAIEPKGKFI